MLSIRLYRLVTGALVAIQAAFIGSRPASDQPSTVVVLVVDELSHRNLTNADVTDLGSGQRRFTNDRGEARFLWPAIGQLRLRVRQIGYQPIEKTIRRENAAEPVTFELKRVAYVLAPVKATSRCATDADSASLTLSVTALEQLKQGADRYEQFRILYPFEASVERRTALVPDTGAVRRIFTKKEKYASDRIETTYRPGRLVKYEGLAFTVPVLFLSNLADSVFWEHHCFIARGTESYEGSRVVRLDFSPTADVHGPDWEGSALLDSATSILRRVEFHLANLKLSETPSKLEGYTTYRSPSPFVVMPDTTMAIWWRWRKNTKAEWGSPNYAQIVLIQELKYRNQAPPANPPPAP